MVRRWSTIAILIGVIMVTSGLFALAWNSYLVILTNPLHVSEFINQSEGDYSADVLDNDVRVANIFVRVPKPVYGGLTEIPTLISIWHEEGTDLKSLEVIFSSNEFLSVALTVPEGNPWPSLQFHRTSDSKGVSFYVTDLGIQGTGTVTLNFLIEMQSSKQSMDFSVHFKLSMQSEAPLTFSRGVAEAQADVRTLRA